MKLLLKIVVGLIVGTITGTLVGTTMLVLPVLFSEYQSSAFAPFMRSKTDWVVLAVYVGIYVSCGPGALIGLIVGITSPGARVGALAGAAVGFAVALVLFAMGAAGDLEISLYAVLSIPAGALVGIITALCVRLLPGGRGPRLP